MTNDVEPSQHSGISPELAYEISRGKAIINLQEQVRKLTIELDRVKGSQRRVPPPRELDVNPIDIVYSSCHEDHDDRGN